MLYTNLEALAQLKGFRRILSRYSWRVIFNGAEKMG